MSDRLDAFFEFVRRGLVVPLGRLGVLVVEAFRRLAMGLWRFRWRVAMIAALVLIVYGVCAHPPFDSVRRGEILVRTDALDGSVKVYTAGTILVLPGIHQLRRYEIRDQQKAQTGADQNLWVLERTDRGQREVKVSGHSSPRADTGKTGRSVLGA